MNKCKVYRHFLNDLNSFCSYFWLIWSSLLLLVFDCTLEFLHSGDHRILLHSSPGLMWSGDFCVSTTSESTLPMLTAFLTSPDPRHSQLCTEVCCEALTQHGVMQIGRPVLMGNTTASATGVTCKTGCCMFSYTEKYPPMQTTERAQTMDGQISAYSWQLRLSQLWWCASTKQEGLLQVHQHQKD